ncbi:eCIS core domain-containing protein [Cyclobacterium plantarum]|uniref:eCIS core domain-containing protein n=1 Tax=Cyclobacterium plantarum TaxID=2716263 RepID=UPI003F7226D2
MKAFTRKSGNKNKSTPGNTGTDFFQAKLQVGQPGDQYEQEADAMADQVIQMNAADQGAWAIKQDETEDNVQKSPIPEKEIQAQPLAQSVTPVFLSESEDKPLQEKEEEEEMLQKQEGEEEIQAALEPNESKEAEDGGEGSIQMKSEQAPEVSSVLESQLKQPSGGSGMDGATRSDMEGSFGADFSQVKIHTGPQAVQMSRDLGAQAFTHGSDIYFNEGRYNPSADSGKHLLAHELTHTLQQGSSTSIQGRMVQKEGDEEEGISPPEGITPIEDAQNYFSFQDREGVVSTFQDGTTKNFKVGKIKLSEFKGRNESLFNPPFEVPRGRSTNQVENWKNELRTGISQEINNKIASATNIGGFNQASSEESRHYFFKGKTNPEYIVFGTQEQLLELGLVPTWDRDLAPATFQVDHIVEHQLGGEDNKTNYELLEASANGSSGSSIAWEMNKKMLAVYNVLDSAFYQDSNRSFTPNLPSRPPRQNQYVNLFLDQGYTISFESRDFTLPNNSGNPNQYWEFSEVQSKDHLNKLEPMSAEEIEALGNESDPSLFMAPTGGSRLDIPPEGQYPKINWLNRLDLKSPPDFVNKTLQVDAYKSSDIGKKEVTASYNDMTWFLDKVEGTYIFYVNKDRTLQNAVSGTGGVFQSLRLPGLSPIQIDQLELTENGFYGIGKVLPTVPLIADADIDIVIDGDGVRLRKLFSAEEFSMPAPFRISETTLEIFFGTQGLGITGQTNFGIDQVGEGHISATASTSGAFELEGAFNFDSELFDPAEINVEYKENTWTIGGEIGIPEGKVRGVKSATITATYSENNFAATGEAELDIPGIERGNMEIQYGEAGFSIGGNFDLSSDIPGITGGNVEARVSKAEGAENYDVFVSGTAQPDIPGISTSLSVTYENGALTIEGSAAYSRGMLSGTIEVGATNRLIGEDGQPAGEPDENMRVYGGGELTLQLTPWLAATAGVRLLPNGEIEVNARLAADSYEVFRRREMNRNLFRVPTIEIPLFAIPLGPRSIGLVAQIGGGLDFTAGFGPGELRNLSAEITYNPEREEETTVAGHGEFAIPADAGLTLRGDLGLGVSVAIASLSGGIELTGTLGLEGEALAEVDVNWSPQTGLALDASGRITVNPKFIFEINAFARASLGVGFLSISETWRHNLASYEWGPGIQFGIVFPVHYREGEPFDMSFDDIEVIYPDLDVIDMAKGLASDIKNDLFA